MLFVSMQLLRDALNMQRPAQVALHSAHLMLGSAIERRDPVHTQSGRDQSDTSPLQQE
jgi:hypothetical protein